MKSITRAAPFLLVMACGSSRPSTMPPPGVEPGGGSGGAPPLAGAGGEAAVDAAGLAPDTLGGVDAPAEPPPPPPAGAVVVEAFKATAVYFAMGDNRRTVYADVDLPAGRWKTVNMRVRLGCPEGGCDVYDRFGYVGVADGDAMPPPVTELVRFATPFGGTTDWTIDVTPLVPLLTGKKKLVAQIDTWVGPGRPPGAGWLLDVTLTFAPGIPDREASQVIPLWDIASYEVGDPAKPIAVPPRMVPIPADAGAVELRSFITGHGQGNLQNCAEFCPKTHAFTANGTSFERRLWREDCTSFCTLTTAGGRSFCKESPTGAVGSVRAPRANWCPGALVAPWSVDVTAAAPAGTTATFAYVPPPYENTCRPGVAVCEGCAFNTGCAYDNGLHTSPKYLHSALLIVYKRAAP